MYWKEKCKETWGRENMYQNHIKNKKKPADQMIKEEIEETRETA
jgi:hypothetical protein